LKGKLNEFRQNPSVVNVMTKSLGSYDTTELLGDHSVPAHILTHFWTEMSFGEPSISKSRISISMESH
ncbi:hypothetical protein, partial [Vibrio crassostreae]|uniref:hypothetical protein n=1 Tax=Vibrio crassostreae TaxID=246167 RepID=UPI001C0F92A8